MTDAAELIEQAPVQDRDLLQRLSLYFDMLDQRLRNGQGWFIFNASGRDSSRPSSTKTTPPSTPISCHGGTSRSARM
jgi:hypothetical protein